MIRRLGAVLRRLRTPWRPGDDRLEADAGGFTATGRDTARRRVAWNEVGEVTVYKRDLWSTDIVCLALFLPGRGETFIVHEEAQGFDAWKAAFEAALPPNDPEWWGKVLLPAFAPNAAVIYRRSDRTASTISVDG